MVIEVAELTSKVIFGLRSCLEAIAAAKVSYSIYHLQTILHKDT